MAAARGVPSIQAAADMINGQRGSIPVEISYWAGRALLIGVGLHFGGIQDEKKLVKAAMVSSGIVSAVAALAVWSNGSRLNSLSGHQRLRKKRKKKLRAKR